MGSKYSARRSGLIAAAIGAGVALTAFVGGPALAAQSQEDCRIEVDRPDQELPEECLIGPIDETDPVEEPEPVEEPAPAPETVSAPTTVPTTEAPAEVLAITQEQGSGEEPAPLVAPAPAGPAAPISLTG